MFELLKAVIFVICCGNIFFELIEAVLEKNPLRGNLCAITTLRPDRSKIMIMFPTWWLARSVVLLLARTILFARLGMLGLRVWSDDWNRVGVYSTLTSCSPPVSSMLTTTTTTKSWRSDTLIILPGWECHTGGSRSKPTVHRCSQSGRRLWVARQVHNHEPNGSAAVRPCQHGSGAVQIHSTMSQIHSTLDRAVRSVGAVSLG